MPDKEICVRTPCNDFWCKIKIIPCPFVKDTDRTADRTGDHVRYFLFCMPAGSGTGGSSGDIVMKHSQHFFKEIISMRRTQKTGKKRIFHCITADRQKIGLTDIVVIFRMKFFHYGENIMDRLFFNSRYKRGDVLIMIIKSASRDTGCFVISDTVIWSVVFFFTSLKKAPRIASSATEYLSSETRILS